MWKELKDLAAKLKAASLKVKIGVGVAVCLALVVGLMLATPLLQKSKGVFNYKEDFRHNTLDELQMASPVTMAKKVAMEKSFAARGSAAESFSPDVQTTWNTSEYEERKVIRQAWMNIEIKNCEESLKKAFDLARSLKAEVFTLDTQNPEKGEAWANVTFLVDPARLDELMDAMSTLGAVKSRHTQARDVTEQYVDLKGQLTNSEHVRERLISLLNSRTGQLKDVLEVERELARIGGTIESLKGKIRYLEAQTDQSRLEVRLYEKSSGKPSAQHPLLRQLMNTLNRFGEVFLETTTGIFVLLGFVLGLAVYAVLILWIILLFKRFLPKATQKNSAN
ncbi:MAG: DUF4349 domain-containing protein [Elusimicrobia bacterium]|nr:DUF4349 domain-containing protein [Candidatus Obscuribacterium magneticum]MCB4755865.1 DUF4349 domain-containing protein [Candidatus Obscuribacterium magneticum]